MKNQKGFTLIELMVVIVIIGILAAVAIPRMTGMGDKAKAAEAPMVISSWESLQAVYGIEHGGTGTGDEIGFTMATPKYFSYDVETAGVITATTLEKLPNCPDNATLISTVTNAGDVPAHTGTMLDNGDCEKLVPNF